MNVCVYFFLFFCNPGLDDFCTQINLLFFIFSFKSSFFYPVTPIPKSIN